MASKHRISYRQQLFLLVSLFAVALTGCFLLFQHGRERLYKNERLDARLQLLDCRIAAALHEGESPEAIYDRFRREFEGLRMTVIDTTGRVLYDSETGGLGIENHLSRPEVRQALADGSGRTVRRHSATADRDCFYSALREGDRIVRTALPYGLTLRELLETDGRYVLYALLIAALLLAVGYLATRNLARNISHLRELTERLDSGEEIDGIAPFPHDELGEISNRMVDLYARLQRTSADLEREHALALREEQEKIRIKRQLTNNINHELKTPVSSIRGYLETILTNPEMDESLRHSFIEKSYAQTERLQRLLQDISLVTRMEEAPRLIARERLDLRPVIEEALADLPEREGQRMRLLIALPEHLPIRGNSTLLTSVFRNLADNAAAYSGGTQIEVRLLDDRGGFYRFSFADNGSGVEPQHLDRIFERFYRIDKGRSRKSGGTGLGLSIVRNAVLFHGGAIEARNRETGGLEFLFTLKIDSEEA